MKIFLTQFILLTAMTFSSASCFKIDINMPPEKPGANDSKPQDLPTPQNSPTPQNLPTPKPPVMVEPGKSEPLEPLAADWRISVVTTGGYTGAGAGNFLAGAAGKLTYQKPRVMGELPPPCETKLDRQETEKLKALAADWRVPNETWQKTLKQSTASDDVEYKMTISSSNADYELEFYGSTIDLLPLPNQNLLDALYDLRDKACGKTVEK